MVTRDKLYRSAYVAASAKRPVAGPLDRDWDVVIDLRYPTERLQNPTSWPPTITERVMFLTGGSRREAPHFAMFEAATRSGRGIDDAYLSFYRALPFDRWYQPFFIAAVRQIASSKGLVLIHCAAGKDRTGILAALLLDVLSVSRDDIVKDYMRSAYARLDEAPLYSGRSDPEMMPGDQHRRDVLSVKPEYILATFEAVDKRCGTTERYLLERGLAEAELNTVRLILTERRTI